MSEKKSWMLEKWNAVYGANTNLPVMTHEEIQAGITYLRSNNYPKPADCPELDCPKHRPACQLNICRIAVGMCGDF